MVIKFAVKEFLEDREFANLSQHTVRNYRRVLNGFHSYCSDMNISKIDEVSRGTIKGFLSHCKHELGNSPATINLKLACLKAFFNFLQSEELYDKDAALFKNIKKAKLDDRVDVFTDRHLKLIFRYLDRECRNKPFHAYRNKLIIITMIGTGMRRGELANLRWSDIDFENNIVSVYGKKRKVASIPITAKLRKELADYYIFAKSHFDGQPGQFVFCTTSKKQITPDTIGSLFKRLGKVLQFDDVRLPAHTFRHSFASRALKTAWMR